MSHTGYEVCFADLERMGRVQTGKQVKGTRYESRPSSLMTGTKTGPIVAVEILVEQDIVSPVGSSWNFFVPPYTGRLPLASRRKMFDDV